MTVSSHRPPLLSLDDALAQLLATVEPLQTTELVATWQADGRVLAQDVVSGLQVPAHDNSAMDGYAVRCADVQPNGATVRVAQRIPAGSVGVPLQPGTAARIFTGALIPAGADAVVMQEDCTVLDAEADTAADADADAVVAVKAGAALLKEADTGPGQGRGSHSIVLTKPPQPGQWIRRAAQDIALGQVVLQRGCKLGPAQLGLAASVGLAELAVVRRPRVALFSTGDELIMPGTCAPADMPPGAIYNSNRFFLQALLRRMGAEVTDLGIVPDQRDATIAALREAALLHDLVLTSGGVSVGEEDHIKPAVQALGSLDLWQIAMKPGKPFAHGRINAGHGRSGACHFIGLPGNPVSSFITFVVLVRPFLMALQGQARAPVPSTPARADFSWPKADKRREFLRVRRNAAGGLDLFANQSSGVLTSVAWADGLVDNPGGHAIALGDSVQFVSFADLLA